MDRKELEVAKIIKLFLITIAIIVAMASVTGCVSPFYGTARIDPGWHMDAGVAATSFIGGAIGEGGGSYIGGRGDLEVRYGLNKYWQINGRVGFGWGAAWWVDEMDPIPAWGTSPTLDAGIGLQAALPLGPVTPAIRVELGPWVLISNFLFSVGQSREWLTLGCRVYVLSEEMGKISFPISGFIGVHPTSRLTIFVGPGVKSSASEGYAPLFSVGLGYKVE
ncbi:hypothetical protein JXM67_01815 [candidate division WOR-3 bacterium]|nr:hypothetical protein [candidate division WOR-3 bacterium]